MLEIQLSEKYYLLSNNKEYILGMKNSSFDTNKSKSNKYVYVAYFSKLGALLNFYINNVMRESNAKTLQELRETLKDVCTSLSNVSIFLECDIRVTELRETNEDSK